jgi:hypothetical protein
MLMGSIPEDVGQRQAAYEYASLGWRVLPLWRPHRGVCSCRKGRKCPTAGKHPRTRHGHADATTDRRRIEGWKWESANVGIATGPGSGLLVIDVDPRNGGRESLADLEARLGKLPAGPMVATGGGGSHLYFCHPEVVVASRTVAPGVEIKAARCFVVAPPSLHESGDHYRWERPPNGPLPDLPAKWSHFLAGKDTNPPCNREAEKQRKPRNRGNPSLPAEALDEQVERAIEETLPKRCGSRNRAVFEFARALKAMPQFADADPEDVEEHVRRWHAEGRRRDVIGTKAFEETWIDFVYGWPRVKLPKGDEPMTAIFERAKEETLPRVAERYNHEGLRQLILLCRELQRATGDRPFYLACRTVGRLLGIDHATAARWLFYLQHEGVIEVAERSPRGSLRANRYRYLGGD